MTAVIFWIAVLMFGACCLAAAADVYARAQARARREGWRAHRAYMDSLKPKPWVKP